MSDEDRQRWDQRYTQGAYRDRDHPSEILARTCTDGTLPVVENALRVPRALDVACGAGRNARYLAGLGYAVDAVDISAVALARGRELAARAGLTVNWLEADLESAASGWLPGATYDLIVVIRYLNLPLVSELGRHLIAGGILLCETHLQTQASVAGPRGARFRAAPGALAQAAQGLQILVSEEGLLTDPDGRTACLARLIATAPGR